MNLLIYILGGTTLKIHYEQLPLLDRHQASSLLIQRSKDTIFHKEIINGEAVAEMRAMSFI